MPSLARDRTKLYQTPDLRVSHTILRYSQNKLEVMVVGPRLNFALVLVLLCAASAHAARATRTPLASTSPSSSQTLLSQSTLTNLHQLLGNAASTAATSAPAPTVSARSTLFPTPEPSDGAADGARLIGAVIGAIVGLVLLVSAAVFCIMRGRRESLEIMHVVHEITLQNEARLDADATKEQARPRCSDQQLDALPHATYRVGLVPAEDATYARILNRFYCIRLPRHHRFSSRLVASRLSLQVRDLHWRVRER